MPVSTDGQICFGVLFEEGYEFPWDSTRWDGDIEDWWIYEVCGYENPFELFNEQGNWLSGEEPPREKVDEYFVFLRNFRDSHPVPVELVNYCSLDYPAYILAIPSTCEYASRGHPKKLDPLRLSVGVPADDLQALEEFCKEHELEGERYGWWLSSYWG